MAVWTWVFGISIALVLGYLFYFLFISERGRTFIWQGIPYYNIADHRRLEVLNYDMNADQKISIVYSDPSQKLGEKFTTGYYFYSFNFYPSITTVDWKNYTGTIIGFKSHDGQTVSIPEMYKNVYEELKQAKMDSQLDRTLMVQEHELRRMDGLEEEKKK